MIKRETNFHRHVLNEGGSKITQDKILSEHKVAGYKLKMYEKRSFLLMPFPFISNNRLHVSAFLRLSVRKTNCFHQFRFIFRLICLHLSKYVFWMCGVDLSSIIIKNFPMYSQLSLSRLRLFRITAYLEEKIWSLF